MPIPLQTAQIIAHDQLEVATKTKELLDIHDVNTDDIIHLEVKTFGANQFLILIAYYGVYTFRIVTGLGNTIGRLLVMGRSFITPNVGLKLTEARLIKIRRGISIGGGFKTSIARLLAIGRIIKVAYEGLGTILDYAYHDSHVSEGISSPEILGVDLIPVISIIRGMDVTTIGCSADITVVYTH